MQTLCNILIYMYVPNQEEESGLTEAFKRHLGADKIIEV